MHDLVCISQKIIEDILTLRCPHCNVVIVDFDGCFAVQHSEGEQGRYQQGCDLYFRGWCFENAEQITTAIIM